MGYARPLGQIVLVLQRSLADVQGVCGSVMFIQIGIHVDVAMKAAGHSSIAMHRHYLSLGPQDVAAAFGTAENLKMNLKMKKGGNR
jgi:hypothetical protein